MTAKVVRRHETGVGVVFTGSIARIDDAIANAAEIEQPADPGAAFATSFGKKGSDA